MLRYTAIGFSIISHPSLLFFFTFLYFSFSNAPIANIPKAGLLYIGTLIFLNTFLFPAIFTYITNKSLWLKKRDDRYVPLLGTIILYLVTWYYLKMAGFPELLTLLMLTFIIGMVVLLILNTRWKISFHTTGMGMVVGFFIGLTFLKQVVSIWPLIIITLLSGLVGSSRLYLKVHDTAQVYWGYGIGLLLTLATWLI